MLGSACPCCPRGLRLGRGRLHTPLPPLPCPGGEGRALSVAPGSPGGRAWPPGPGGRWMSLRLPSPHFRPSLFVVLRACGGWKGGPLPLVGWKVPQVLR